MTPRLPDATDIAGVLTDPSLALNYARWLPADQDAAILDLGCGDGRVLRWLAARGHRNLHGIDRDRAALDSMGNWPGLQLECADVSAARLRDLKGRYRLIVLRQMVYYIDRRDILEFMLALRDALDDDGVLIVEFFNGALLSSRTTELKDPFIRTAYTEHSMRRLFDAASLATLHVGPELRPAPSTLRSHVYALLRRAWTSTLRAIFILERGLDGELPRIWTKSLLAVARRPAGLR